MNITEAKNLIEAQLGLTLTLSTIGGFGERYEYKSEGLEISLVFNDYQSYVVLTRRLLPPLAWGAMLVDFWFHGLREQSENELLFFLNYYKNSKGGNL